MAKAKAKNQTKGKQAKGKPLFRGLPWFAWLLIALAIAGIVVFVRIYPVGQPPADNGGKLKAAIVDQLSSFRENEDFITEVTSELEDYGFEVDLYQGNNITVDFYRGLSGRGYKLIVFRSHSGILEGEEQTYYKTTLFTNEEFDWKKHQLDVLDDRLFMASIAEGYPWVFSISQKFISKSMTKEFDDTVIIMMGCSGIYLTDLAEAFVDKGASAYLAWDASVDLHYVDEATPYLIGQLCSEKATIKEAVDSTMDVIGPDPKYEAELKYYPSGTGDKTLEELIR
ncbi:MAG: hypothetical protein WBE46_01385 [Dehalococcoidia bacterium]